MGLGLDARGFSFLGRWQSLTHYGFALSQPADATRETEGHGAEGPNVKKPWGTWPGGRHGSLGRQGSVPQAGDGTEERVCPTSVICPLLHSVLEGTGPVLSPVRAAVQPNTARAHFPGSLFEHGSSPWCPEP
ncbi:hypothetical protein mRhiFer1_008688 [Rhinolophus ferrumequinum]|uniref:Uncharacterized protein n=1 Tax=Rhinolophus ferrumequinum TaxID=59479 RepID=A0A7J7TQC6_RHIFE|nr:hypothetical protein mRhiFer1_008688 [Rhinolophus ferrumequinum]